ncbi:MULTISPECIES: bifunctional phosphopantothenoylcysteine decarboxylase/phosphopantothenate--cysteine ligase CoaBC [Culturomica]|jgi:phosphopantothenoylcysteine decarboxylase/phosphopantothenate--cysteine ligase|uniref:bifunctional phosphopantothenoylcysteine decarboxylase/phosphopantothenate--cysteine ligase CoaBC n=1 Tax=Culturomica TaxID=1926651 RepID=UPI000E560A3B|nr:MULTISPECIES: bifunctional phosphopantothenoylcysteine decarboxylase/phosphopantothenate--cysteine ligase CoaBC [Odoribacteraceae]RHV97685.1 bifunctional phosphopantothenoylcysteine decarboxylase/phosphopantothenate--cysteine ligase CoaBC [Odoribacter sp. OF09-27XD]HBO27465.1 bifunctional phosphopantothenoylcysteine decarboxylase/phosphopantothenate--cysteine ligase CoaBC [Culturomica sp.]
MLKGKHIILGITGSIAAYKAALLARLLVKEGAEVQVVMTALAKEFITPLTMATLTKKPILVDFYNPENGDWNSHVDLGLWADLMLIAPATANTIGKMASGIADNLLLTTYLSAKCPVVVAPAMDLDMYRHSATQRNLAVLRSFGNVIIEPEDGELASGLTGKGRMEEPENIVRLLERYFTAQAEFAGKKVLITAGPTYEKIDPVRFIGNYSTGKMGFALAEEFARRGAEVVLVAGPVTLTTGHPSIRRVDVESAAEMYAEVIPAAADCDIIVSCAAVADFTPEEKAVSKIKREGENLCLKLQPTQDIAAELGKRKKEGQLLVGFALETDNEQCNAFQKLKKKNLDLIVLNSLKDEGAGFGGDTNKVTMIDRREHIQEYALKSKREVACDIVGRVKNLLS